MIEMRTFLFSLKVYNDVMGQERFSGANSMLPNSKAGIDYVQGLGKMLNKLRELAPPSGDFTQP